MTMHFTRGCFAIAFLTFSLGIGEGQEDKAPAKSPTSEWSVPGTWSGVACKSSGKPIYATDLTGNCIELNAAGEIQQKIKLAAKGGNTLRIANRAGEEGVLLLTFSLWSSELQAFDLQGKLQWSYPAGIDDVWAADLDGDKNDEIIVGYNGMVGVHVLNSQGKLIWKNTDIGNVWHVCAGDVLGDGTQQVVTTSAAGKIHIFSSDGKTRKDIQPGGYANMIRVGKSAETDQTAAMIVGEQSVFTKPKVTRVSPDGKVLWALTVSGKVPSQLFSAALAPDQPWFATGMGGGLVHVIDTAEGKLLLTVKENGIKPEVGWASRSESATPLLLIATGEKLEAFAIPSAK